MMHHFGFVNPGLLLIAGGGEGCSSALIAACCSDGVRVAAERATQSSKGGLDEANFSRRVPTQRLVDVMCGESDAVEDLVGLLSYRSAGGDDEEADPDLLSAAQLALISEGTPKYITSACARLISVEGSSPLQHVDPVSFRHLIPTSECEAGPSPADIWRTILRSVRPVFGGWTGCTPERAERRDLAAIHVVGPGSDRITSP